MAQIGLQAGRARLAAHASALGTIVPRRPPGRALRAHRRPDIHATELPGFHRRLYRHRW